MKILCIYGCGGMGREIADLTHQMDKWDEIYFVDDNIKFETVDEISVIQLEEAISKFEKNDAEFIVSAGEPSSRQDLYEELESKNIKVTNIIDPNFVLSKFSKIQEGTIFHRGATATVNVNIDKGCLINKHVVIGHDVRIGKYSVISPKVSIGGNVEIGQNCYIGSGAIIRNGIKIGENSIIGMGAVVLEDVKPRSVMVGNPAKFLRKNKTNKVF